MDMQRSPGAVDDGWHETRWLPPFLRRLFAGERRTLWTPLSPAECADRLNATMTWSPLSLGLDATAGDVSATGFTIQLRYATLTRGLLQPVAFGRFIAVGGGTLVAMRLAVHPLLFAPIAGFVGIGAVAWLVVGLRLAVDRAAVTGNPAPYLLASFLLPFGIALFLQEKRRSRPQDQDLLVFLRKVLEAEDEAPTEELTARLSTNRGRTDERMH